MAPAAMAPQLPRPVSDPGHYIGDAVADEEVIKIQPKRDTFQRSVVVVEAELNAAADAGEAKFDFARLAEAVEGAERLAAAARKGRAKLREYAAMQLAAAAPGHDLEELRRAVHLAERAGIEGQQLEDAKLELAEAEQKAKFEEAERKARASCEVPRLLESAGLTESAGSARFWCQATGAHDVELVIDEWGGF
mmetsp:Transcript_41251/g.131107  ORF Transcript_41251/g.131107 Transcript_41251/m.131107 type:complete len:193 (-) Transcript_41251:75-653(-)